MATSFSSETFAKRRAIFLSVRKTVNTQGYSKLREPIKTRENCYPAISEILIVIIIIIIVIIIIRIISIVIIIDVFQAGKLDVYFETEEKIMSKATLVSSSLNY